VVRYLDSLDAISQVQPQTVSEDGVVFLLTSRRGRLAVSQSIALGHTLVADASQPLPPAGENDPGNVNPGLDLVYRLVP